MIKLIIYLIISMLRYRHKKEYLVMLYVLNLKTKSRIMDNGGIIAFITGTTAWFVKTAFNITSDVVSLMLDVTGLLSFGLFILMNRKPILKEIKEIINQLKKSK